MATGNIISGGSSAAATAGGIGTAAVNSGSMDASTASAIAQMQAAMEAMNAINAAQALFQVMEAGPKGAKTLTQG